VVVGDRDVSGLAITLRPGSSISGTIAWDGEQAPGDSTGVHAEPAHGDPWLGMPSGGIGRSPGSTFAVGGLVPGEYVLKFRWFLVRSIEWQGRDYTDRAFDTSNGDITGVRVTFTAKKAQLSGTVRSHRGTVADDAAVLVFPVDRSGWTAYGLSPTRIVTELTSTAGTFRFASLPGGEYFAIALDSGLAASWKDPEFLERASTVATRVSLGWGQSVTLDLRVTQVSR
jgi:hypothetical protein